MCSTSGRVGDSQGEPVNFRESLREPWRALSLVLCHVFTDLIDFIGFVDSIHSIHSIDLIDVIGFIDFIHLMDVIEGINLIGVIQFIRVIVLCGKNFYVLHKKKTFWRQKKIFSSRNKIFCLRNENTLSSDTFEDAREGGGPRPIPTHPPFFPQPRALRSFTYASPSPTKSMYWKSKEQKLYSAHMPWGDGSKNNLSDLTYREEQAGAISAKR